MAAWATLGSRSWSLAASAAESGVSSAARQGGRAHDAATQKQLDRGYRMVELLKQPQYQPLSVVDQIIGIYAGTKGYLDNVPVNEVQEWEKDMQAFMRSNKQAVLDELEQKQQLDDELIKSIQDALVGFNRQYGADKPKEETVTV